MRRGIARWVAVAAVVGTLFGAVSLIQARLTARRPEDWLSQRMSYLPKSEVLKPMLLGFGSTYAQYLWFKTVNYFGAHHITDRQYPWLVHMVDMVTRINPYFEPAYEWAGLMLPELCDSPEAALVILERGVFYLGDKSYKPQFYLGSLYLNRYHDRRLAADHMAMAAPVAGEHSWKLARMAATFYGQAGLTDESRATLLFMLETTESPAVRKVLAEKLKTLGVGASTATAR